MRNHLFCNENLVCKWLHNWDLQTAPNLRSENMVWFCVVDIFEEPLPNFEITVLKPLDGFGDATCGAIDVFGDPRLEPLAQSQKY